MGLVSGAESALSKNLTIPARLKGSMQKTSPGLPAATNHLLSKISSLMDDAEKALNRVAGRLCLALPAKFEIRQTVSMIRIKVVGFTDHAKRFEEALNSDVPFRYTFQSIRIRYGALRTFEVVQRSTYACFTIVYCVGKLNFKPPARSEQFFDRLIAEFNSQRMNKHTYLPQNQNVDKISQF